MEPENFFDAGLSETQILEQVSKNGAPLVCGDEVMFVFNGAAERVAIAGDFTGWEPADLMRRVNDNLWCLKKRFPISARIDYKLVVDGNWINDPLNRKATPSGFGVNSTVVMPGYETEFPEDTRIPTRGQVIRNLDYYSHFLGKTMYYHLYLPSVDAKVQPNSVIYALDGGEYLDFGAIIQVADYMIDRGELPSSVIVLLDPSERTKEYTIYEPYRDYVIQELMPYIEDNYLNGVDRTKPDRAAIGVSWGGLTAFYLALSTQNLFSRVLSQSGSFWPKDGLMYDMVATFPKQEIYFCLQTGMLGDTEEMNDAMVQILKAMGYKLKYQKYAEGHSWGNWKGHLYEGLRELFSVDGN